MKNSFICVFYYTFVRQKTIKMKILHTSDWHLGHVLYNYERTEEQILMLEQITRIVEEHKPDVFLLCGDVYHTSQPSSLIQTIFTVIREQW